MNTETIELPGEVRWYLGALKAAGELEALRRVAKVPPEKWGHSHGVDWEGKRCLVGHAEDYRRYRDGGIRSEWDKRPIGSYPLDEERRGRVPHAFDAFAREHGAALAGHLCATYARRLLEGPGK